MWMRRFGIVLVLSGALLLFNGLSSITGFSIFESLELNVSSFLGIIFVVAGIILFMSSTLDMRASPLGGLEQSLDRVRQKHIRTSLHQTFREYPASPHHTGPVPVLIDTDFAKKIYDERVGFTPGFFRGYTLELSEKALHEMQYYSDQHHRRLVPQQTISYLLGLTPSQHSIIHAEDIAKTEQAQGITPHDAHALQEAIYYVWKTQTKKGQRAQRHTQEKFRKGADLIYLYYGLLRGEQETVILSEDADIRDTAECLRTQGIEYNGKTRKAHLYVLGFDDVFKSSDSVLRP